MSGVFFRTIRRFRTEEKGVVLILFVLLVLPLLLVIAVAIDFSQTLVVKRQLTNAVDAAALAIGSQSDLNDQADLDAEAERYIRAHYAESDIGTLKTHTVQKIGDDPRQFEIQVSATVEIPTHFMKIGGVETLTVSANSAVFREEKDVEVVMVLDNSGSMGSGNKLEDMKTAAKQLVDILFAAEEEPDNVRIGLVPFTGAVNLGVPSTTSWLDRSNPAPLNAQYLDVPVTVSLPGLGDDITVGSAFDVLDIMEGGIGSRWGGCVRSRYRFDTGVDDLDITDTPPKSADPSTLFSAYFKPFAGRDILDYVGSSNSEVNDNCPEAEVQPLTNNKTTITSAIDAMVARGNTNIPEGLSWGWRVISPGEPFTEGEAYSTSGILKAVIVLSDGENQVENGFSSYGEAFNTDQFGSDPNGDVNQKLTQACANVKANHDADSGDTDILLYTIAFGSTSSTIETLMQNCATTPNKHYFRSPTAEDLENAFQSIASSLNQLRIKQ